MTHWGSIALISFAAFLVGLCIGVFAYRQGYKRGRFDEQIDGSNRQLERNRAGKHRAASPRITPSGQEAGQGQRPGPSPPRDWPRHVARPAVTAADIRPVAMPDLCLPSPTETFERLPTDTGELRAVTDTWIHGMREREHAYRKGLTS